MPGSTGEALLQIDRGSGEVLQCNAAACAQLHLDVDQVRGVQWMQVLEGDPIAIASLSQAILSQRHVHLPPFVLRRKDGIEIVFGGFLIPSSEGEAPVTNLIFWQVSDESLPGLAQMPQSGDSIAVLGVDQTSEDDSDQPSNVGKVMAGVTASLQGIVRSGDIVSAPMGTSVIIVLRAVNIPGAQDICRALLSHLHRMHKSADAPFSVSRLCVGLAHLTPARGALAGVLAANNAMMLARDTGRAQKVRVEAELDAQQLMTAAVNSGGIFGGGRQQQSGPEKDLPELVAPPAPMPPPVLPIEKDIDGYVVDNMEGAVDQAMFLARLDIPVAIVGPAGTGKMYVAKVMHDESGGAAEMLTQLDCRDFRGRRDAESKIARELTRGEGRTLVFKSPHLMNAEAQQKLARQISSRTLADSNPPRVLRNMKFIALFPQSLERLMRKNELVPALASVFGGFPINVPPVKDRKQAVLRWAHKILGQEGIQRDREMRGFTPDAERAMLLYDWPGNISEMRQCISDAMDKTDKNWLTPVDLGLFDGIDPEGAAYVPESKPYLAVAELEEVEEEGYVTSTLESLDVALGQAVRALLALERIKPLGTWLEDDLVAATLERYRGDLPRAGDFLHTRPRNISRWLPKLESRDEERSESALWQTPRRILREWVRESSQLEESPMLMLQSRLLAHIEEQATGLSVAKRAQVLGVSTPTYLKRLKELGSV